MPCLTLQNTLPSASILFCRPYSLMTSQGNSSNFILKYLYWLIGVSRYKSLRSIVMNSALGVEIMLLTNEFHVSRFAVGAPQLSG